MIKINTTAECINSIDCYIVGNIYDVEVEFKGDILDSAYSEYSYIKNAPTQYIRLTTEDLLKNFKLK